ncbi:MAG: 5-(carboxyamino)imidazole ribonucleotide mutase [Pirellulales bacterium]
MGDTSTRPLVGIIMGSKNDWEVMKGASAILTEFGIAHEAKAISAHRSPDVVADYAKSAEERGLEVIIAAAGMSAALPGVAAAMTLLPVLGVPMEGKVMGGLDALLTIAQMPGGVPVGALAVGSAGAKNSALLALRILANSRPELREKLRLYYSKMAEDITRDCDLH